MPIHIETGHILVQNFLYIGKYVNSLQSLLCSSIQKKINLLKLNKEAFSFILKCETTTFCGHSHAFKQDLNINYTIQRCTKSLTRTVALCLHLPETFLMPVGIQRLHITCISDSFGAFCTCPLLF